ncbi:MAG: fimbria/pilus outer membrane usher protein [Holosporales bacterium]|nr:fimbria/pilus outer membrane usher protein [Holosporales bacterium]
MLIPGNYATSAKFSTILSMRYTSFAFLFIFIGLKTAFADPVVVSSNDHNVLENEEELLAKVFGSKREKKDVLMEFNLLLDGEKVGEIMVMIGGTNKVLAKSIKEALVDYLAEEEIKKIDAAKDENGFISFETLDLLKLDTKFDATKLQVEINVPVNLKKTRGIEIGSKGRKEKPNVTPATFSGFTNAHFSNTSHSGMYKSNSRTLILTPVINLLGITLEGECSYEQDSTSSKRRFKKDYTALVYDWPEEALLFQIGDIFSHSVDYHSVPKVFGFSFYRNSLLKSGDDLTNDIPVTLLRQSTIEVYVNDALVKTKTNVAPGTYILNSIPCTYGFNNVKIKIIDDAGREQFLNANVFLDSSFVRKGESSYGLTIGYPEASNNKKNFVTSAFIKYGLMAAIECQLGILLNRIGKTVSAGIKNKNILGFLEGKYAQSKYKEGNIQPEGKIFSLSYISPSWKVIFPINLGISVEKSDQFFYPYLNTLKDTKEDSGSFLSQQKNRNGGHSAMRCSLFISDFLGLNLGFNYGVEKSSDNTQNRFSVNATKYIAFNNEIFSSIQLHCSFEQVLTRDKKADRIFSFTGSVPLKGGTTLSTRGNNKSSYDSSISYQPHDNGFGYNASFNKNKESKSYIANTSYRHSRFRANLNYNRTSNSSHTTQVGLGTGLFFVDGVVAVAGNDTSDGGFVIVRPKGALANENLKFLNSSAESGILGGAVLSAGKNINSFRLDLNELLDKEVDQDTIVVHGYYKRGALAEISAEGSYIAKGKLQDAQGAAITLASGFAISKTNTEAAPVQFFTNDEGIFAITNLNPGKYKVTVNVEGYEDFEIEIPESAEQFIDLGTITCKDSQ